jgi:hypothetical protein
MLPASTHGRFVERTPASEGNIQCLEADAGGRLSLFREFDLL